MNLIRHKHNYLFLLADWLGNILFEAHIHFQERQCLVPSHYAYSQKSHEKDDCVNQYMCQVWAWARSTDDNIFGVSEDLCNIICFTEHKNRHSIEIYIDFLAKSFIKRITALFADLLIF